MIKTSIALQNGSQLVAETLDPKTILVAKKIVALAINPKAPVRSTCILGKQKAAIVSVRARYIMVFGWLALKL